MNEPTLPGLGAAQSAGTLREFLARGAGAQRAVNNILDEHEKASRSNYGNDGRSFQKEIERTCGGYQSRRAATIRKVDPPTRLIGTGANRKVIFLANPFLDFVGTWTARHGRAIVLECKSTQTHRLPFRRSGGLTDEQLGTIKTWRHAGAAVALLWRWNERVALFTPEQLVAFEAAAVKSLLHESGVLVPRGEGNVVWDFLAVLERLLWPQTANASPEEVAAAVNKLDAIAPRGAKNGKALSDCEER